MSRGSLVRKIPKGGSGTFRTRLVSRRSGLNVMTNMNSQETDTDIPTMDMSIFKMLDAPVIDGIQARLGQVILPRRKAMRTPHHIAVTSRGVVPHLSQDVFRQHTEVDGVYMALEDCALNVESLSLSLSHTHTHTLSLILKSLFAKE